MTSKNNLKMINSKNKMKNLISRSIYKGININFFQM